MSSLKGRTTGSGVSAAIAGLVLGLLIGRATAPGLGAQLDDARARAAPIASSLEVIRTEYPKLVAGGADPGGAELAMARIESAYAAVKPSLDAIDTTGSAALGDSIGQLRSGLTARVPEADLAVLIAAVETRLVGVLPG